MALFACSLSICLWICLGANIKHSDIQTHSLAPLPNLDFSADEFTQLGTLTNKIKVLSNPQTAHAKGVQFSMLGESKNMKTKTTKIIVQVKPFNYRVSMIFISATNNYAVIDGKFVHVGDRLRYGAILKAIRKGKVLISRADGSRWVKIKNTYGLLLNHIHSNDHSSAEHILSLLKKVTGGVA